jgi:lipopolysaccharide biosynthesis protein
VGSIRLVAFYLTQFHPTPENDEWWGKGFTEWTNVTKARPLFEGHYQPHLPTDLGFYDLRLRESRHDQIAMARQYGIDAFCYHYYWFSGTRLLHRPLDDMLADPDSDMPFCLCWANENWTRRWDAAEHEVLIAQKYRPEDDLEFIKSLIPFFSDPRYLRVDAAPVLVVYRPQHLPNPKKTLWVWREYCASIGISRLHLVCALTHGNMDYEKYGFDAGVEFPPHQPDVPSYSHRVSLNGEFRGIILDYPDLANLYLDRRYSGANVYRGVFPSWDNAARCGPNSLVVLNGTPRNYERWLGEAVRRTGRDFPDRERLVFINAWNEWAEGCHLEPDRKYGRGFLEATLRVKQGRSTAAEFPDVGPPPRRRAVASEHRPEPRPRLQPAIHMAVLGVRKVLGLLLQPFPRLRQLAVRAYLSLFSQHA